MMVIEDILCESSRSPYLKVISAVLESVVRECSGQSETAFDARRRPTVPLHDYLRRWMRYTRCGVIVVVVSVMLIDRVCMSTGMPVTPLNVHRFLLAALTVSSKWHNDIPFLNTHYAQVGGVAVNELNMLEREFLSTIEFQLSVTTEELETYVKMFRNHRAWPTEEQDNVTTHSTPRVTGLSPRTYSGPDTTKFETAKSVDTCSCTNTENGLSDSKSSSGRLPVPPRANRKSVSTPRGFAKQRKESEDSLPVIESARN